MEIEIGQLVTHPHFSPYPRFGRVASVEADGVSVEDVHCGDPRCSSEHVHSKQLWPIGEIESVRAYQPRAPWEWGRKTSPNTPIV